LRTKKGSFHVRNLDLLMVEILKIPGDKIITLTDQDQCSFKVDVSQEGVFGYQSGVKELFLAKLMKAFYGNGAIIIREFLPVKVERVLSNGKKMWIPEKNLYGIALQQGEWVGLSQEELQQCYATDAKSGQPLNQEDGVRYRKFPLD
jgi:hypothetical protein